MVQEDLENIIGILGRIGPNADVSIPGGVFSTGELLGALTDANRYRWLRDRGNLVFYGRGDEVDRQVDFAMSKPPVEGQF